MPKPSEFEEKILAPRVPPIKQRARNKKIYVDKSFYPDGMEVNYDHLSEVSKQFLVKNRVVREKSLKTNFNMTHGSFRNSSNNFMAGASNIQAFGFQKSSETRGSTRQ